MNLSRNEHAHSQRGGAYVEMALVLSLLVTIGTPIFGTIWPKIEAINAGTDGYETIQGFNDPFTVLIESQGGINAYTPAALARLDETGDIRLNQEAGTILFNLETRANRNKPESQRYCFFVISSDGCEDKTLPVSLASNSAECGSVAPPGLLSSITRASCERKIYLGAMQKPNPNLPDAKEIFAVFPLYNQGYDKLVVSDSLTGARSTI